MENALWMCIAKSVFTLIRWNVVRWPCSKKQQADWFMRSEVAQLCTTLWDPIDCSLPDSSSINFAGKSTGLDCYLLLQGIFSTRDRTQVSRPHYRQMFYPLSHQESLPDSLNPQLLHQSFSRVKSRMSLCFAGRLDAAAIQVSQDKWLLFDVLLQFQVHKNASISVSKMCKFISRIQSIYPWMLTPVFVFTLMRVKLYCQRTSQQERVSCVFLSENRNTWWKWLS